MFSASRNCVQILATWSWMNDTTVGLRICSRSLCSFKIQSIKTLPCSLSIRYTCPHITPLPPWAARPLTSANRSPTRSRTRCHLPHTVKTRIQPWREHLSKVPDAIECEHWPNQVGYAYKLRSDLDPDEDGEHADELLRQFLTVAVWVAGLRQSWRGTSRIWRPWAGMVTLGWGWLDILITSAVLPMPLRQLIGREINLQLTGSSSGGQVNMPTSLTVLSDFRRAFYGGQPEDHLSNNRAV